MQTRSGNTQAPDATWSDWSAPYAGEGRPAHRQRARALPAAQGHAHRARRAGPPCSRRVTAAYLQRNLRPAGATDHRPSARARCSRSRSRSPASPRSWASTLRAPDRPRGGPRPPRCRRHRLQPEDVPARAPDLLLARRRSQRRHPHLRRVLPAPWARAASARCARGLTEAVLAWDTSTVPNGRYVVKVVASDAPVEPGGLALTGDKESGPSTWTTRRPRSPPPARRAPRARIRAVAQGRREPAAQGRVLGRRRALGGGPPPGRHQRRPRGDLRVHAAGPLRPGAPRGGGAGHRPARQRRAARGSPEPCPRAKNALPRSRPRACCSCARAPSATCCCCAAPSPPCEPSGIDVGLLAPPAPRSCWADGPAEVQEWLPVGAPGLARPLRGRALASRIARGEPAFVRRRRGLHRERGLVSSRGRSSPRS